MAEKDPSNPDQKNFWKGVFWLGALLVGAEILLDN
jgi:hypothetical protein